MKLGSDVNLHQIAEDTDHFTGAELEGLCREAGIVALREDISATVVSDRHFQKVMNSLKPALTREEIDSYSSFMKKSASQFHQIQCNTEVLDKTTTKHYFPMGTVTFGVLGLLVATAAKYVPWCIDRSSSKTTAT